MKYSTRMGDGFRVASKLETPVLHIAIAARALGGSFSAWRQAISTMRE